MVAAPSSPTSLPSLEEAYEACRRETAEWAKTFYLGTLLMPPAKRRAIWAIYVWCRRTDELMDSPEAMARPVEELAARLDAWEQRTRALFAGEVRDGLDLGMRDTIERYPQPIEPYLDMIEGMRMDLTTHRYATFEQLKLYCYRVAGTVGLMTQEVMGIDPAYTSAPWSHPPDTSEAAVALGIANQLTNILRDVGEDLRQLTAGVAIEQVLVNHPRQVALHRELNRVGHRRHIEEIADAIQRIPIYARRPRREPVADAVQFRPQEIVWFLIQGGNGRDDAVVGR